MPDVLLDGLVFPEGPRWRDGRLWFSDMRAGKVMNVDLDGRAEVVCEVEQLPSGLGWLPDGRMLIVSMHDQKLLRREPDGRLVEHADLSGIAVGDCNDMVVDGQGRAYVGNFGWHMGPGAERKTTSIALVDPDGTVRVAGSGVLFPNGAVITPDGRTFIVAETFARKLTAFDINSDGTLANPRTFAELGRATPDGICLDAEGAVWVASPFTREFIRVRDGGEVAERISLADRMAVACMLGGEDRRTLFLLTASGSDADMAAGRTQGFIETAPVAVPGAGWP